MLRNHCKSHIGDDVCVGVVDAKGTHQENLARLFVSVLFWALLICVTRFVTPKIVCLYEDYPRILFSLNENDPALDRFSPSREYLVHACSSL